MYDMYYVTATTERKIKGFGIQLDRLLSATNYPNIYIIRPWNNLGKDMYVYQSKIVDKGTFDAQLKKLRINHVFKRKDNELCSLSL